MNGLTMPCNECNDAGDCSQVNESILREMPLLLRSGRTVDGRGLVCEGKQQERFDKDLNVKKESTGEGECDCDEGTCSNVTFRGKRSADALPLKTSPRSFVFALLAYGALMWLSYTCSTFVFDDYDGEEGDNGNTDEFSFIVQSALKRLAMLTELGGEDFAEVQTELRNANPIPSQNCARQVLQSSSYVERYLARCWSGMAKQYECPPQ